MRSALLLLVCALPASAQEPRRAEAPPSHISLGLSETDLARNLAARLSRVKQFRDLDEATLERLRQSANLDKLGDLLKRFQNGETPNDPGFKQALNDILEKNPELKNPETLERLRKRFEQQLGPRSGENPLRLPFEKLIPPPTPTPGPTNGTGPPGEMPTPPVRPLQPNDPQSGPPPPTPTPPAPEQPPENEKLRDLMKWASERGGKFAQSESFQKLIKDFTDKKFALDPNNPAAAKFQEWLKGAGQSLESAASKIEKPPGWNWPTIKTPDLKLPAWRPPDVSVPDVGGVASAGKPLVALVVLAIVVVAVVLALRQVQLRHAAAASAPARALPTLPAVINTRADLIRAYECLGLINGGRPAETWHHRRIADHLSGDDAARHDAANRLADLYEESRYAPAASPLAEEQLAAARRDLRLLAGAPRL